MNQSTLLLYNNVLALPLMAAFMLLATNEAAEVVRYPQVRGTAAVPQCTALWSMLV